MLHVIMTYHCTAVLANRRSYLTAVYCS